MGMEIKARKEEALSHVENVNVSQKSYKQKMNDSKLSILNMYRSYRKSGAAEKI